jgi:hypothetical protein
MNKKLNRKIGALIATIMVVSLIAAIAPTVSAGPIGATYNEGNTSTYTGGTSGYDAATGGYISEANLSTSSSTTKWQGYYGNLSGYIVLADSSGHAMFNWTALISNGGEVFAVARAAVPTFTVVDTNDITEANADTALTTDSTWSAVGSDSVTLTFSTDNDNSVFYVAGQTVTASTRNRLYTLDSDGNSAFQEVILTDQSSIDDVGDMIWTCLIVDNSENYKGNTSDFQMIVPTTDKAGLTTTYYFYVELT